MKNANLDKLIVGFLLGVCLMLAIGVGGKEQANPVGTYRLATAQGANAFVLNSRTGRLWVSGAVGGRVTWMDCGSSQSTERLLPEGETQRDTSGQFNRRTLLYDQSEGDSRGPSSP